MFGVGFHRFNPGFRRGFRGNWLFPFTVGALTGAILTPPYRPYYPYRPYPYPPYYY